MLFTGVYGNLIQIGNFKNKSTSKVYKVPFGFDKTHLKEGQMFLQSIV